MSHDTPDTTNSIKREILKAATRIASLAEGFDDESPCLYLGESDGDDGIHFCLDNPLDDKEGSWLCVPWEEMLDALKGATTQDESMHAITKIKEVIKQYEEWTETTHAEWISSQDADCGVTGEAS